MVPLVAGHALMAIESIPFVEGLENSEISGLAEAGHMLTDPTNAFLIFVGSVAFNWIWLLLQSSSNDAGEHGIGEAISLDAPGRVIQNSAAPEDFDASIAFDSVPQCSATTDGAESAAECRGETVAALFECF
jgi:hypothetical protein